MSELDISKVFEKMDFTLQIGIPEKKLLRGSQFKKIASKYGGVANKKTTKPWDGKTTAHSSFASVNRKIGFVASFWDDFSRKAEYVLKGVFEAGFRDSIEKKRRLENSMVALMKKAYLREAGRLRNHPRKAKVKGFNRYAVGTGETLDSIKASVDL